MSASQKLLVDTSAWIAYFAGDEPMVHALGRPMRERRIVICGQVKQELLQGTRDDKKFATLEQQLSTWSYEAEMPDDFVDAARLYARLRWKGTTIGAADCLIAALAKRCGFVVCATDPHFEHIPDLRLYNP
jgi:predicted nucleic acid-binding protein